MNIQQTNGHSVTEWLPIEVTVRELIALRNKHGAETPVGYRCSNIVELIQLPEVPRSQLGRQMADLQRLLAAQ